MSLELLLQERYPRCIKLRDDREVTIRPILQEDEQGLLEFFQKVPLGERRLYRRDVADPAVIRGWCREIDYQKNLPILAFHGDRIVADLNLHRSNVQASRHVASLRITVDHEFWGRGLGRSMVQDTLELAPKIGVAYIDVETLPAQERIIGLLERMDFLHVGTLPQHVRDVRGRFHDVVLMTLMVIAPGKLSPDAKVPRDELDIGGSD